MFSIFLSTLKHQISIFCSISNKLLAFQLDCHSIEVRFAKPFTFIVLVDQKRIENETF